MQVTKFIKVVQRRIIQGEDSIVRLTEPLFAIETHMSMAERMRLFSLANALPEGFVACEIGSYLGASTCFLASAASSRAGAVHCVDTWDNRSMGHEPARDTFATFMGNIEPFRKCTIIHRGESSTMSAGVPNQLDLLFVDADHSYAGVKTDLAHYGPKLKPGGLLLLHDYDYPEVRQATTEFLARRPARDLGTTHSLQAFQMNG